MHPVSFVSTVTGEFSVIPVALSRTFFMAEVLLCTNSFTSISPFTFRIVQNICWGCKIALFFCPAGILHPLGPFPASCPSLSLCEHCFCIPFLFISAVLLFIIFCLWSCHFHWNSKWHMSPIYFIFFFFFVVLLYNSLSRSTFEKKRHRIWSLIFFFIYCLFSASNRYGVGKWPYFHGRKIKSKKEVQTTENVSYKK